MKIFTKPAFFLLLIVCALIKPAKAQTGVLDPNDPIEVYNPASPPSVPAFGTLKKWVKTNRLSWNTSSFKCYFYKGVAFRLRFPKSYQHNVNDGKKYPVYIFFHGRGEKGTIYDNEYQLYHGGQNHMNAVDAGKFDGFLLYPQNQNDGWGSQLTYMSEFILNYLVPQVKADRWRVIANGLSAGGAATWSFLINNVKTVAAALPISDADPSYTTNLQQYKFTPIWQFQGEIDKAPTLATTQNLRNNILNAGGNHKLTVYPDMGHSVWYPSWREPDFYPFLNRVYKSNPWALGGRTEFCPGTSINVTVGVTPGFTAYEWRKDDVPISGATGNQITVTSIGKYSCRIKDGTEWSDWSPIPVDIKIKTETVLPVITVQGMASRVIPSLDGSTGVTIGIPAEYTSYAWQRVGSTTTLGTNNTYNVTAPGDYRVRITEQFGCSSVFTAPFTVVDANGPNKPDAPFDFTATVLSKTAIRLNWNNTASPVNDETGFEIFSAPALNGPYKLVAVTDANVLTYTHSGLTSNTAYFYKIRAINNTAASDGVGPINATTQADIQPPTTPANLTVSGNTRYSVALSWMDSEDDVAVTAYDVFVNGKKLYTTPEPQITIYNLAPQSLYSFKVRAKDMAGNYSPFSNQVRAQTVQKGLIYRYYQDSWTSLPDFRAKTPVETGMTSNVDITPRLKDDNFGFVWEGYITITTPGSYTFRTNSDAGSKLYLGALNGTGSPYLHTATALVNNDGVHGPQSRDGTINLSAGTYPFAVSYFETTGGQSIAVSWKLPGTSTFVTIPDSVFVEKDALSGAAPVAPSQLTATASAYDKVNLSWADNSNNETGFEIWRATGGSTNYVAITTTAANATSFIDNTVSPATTYFYKIRALGEFGESEFSLKTTESLWKFNNNYSDSSLNNRTLVPGTGVTFDDVNKMEGTHAVKFSGTGSQYATIGTSGNSLNTGFAERTVAFWMKSFNNTGNRIIADLGGADNGLALVLDNNNLVAGIASANAAASITAAYSSSDWSFIALVYKANTLKLYINGTLAAENNSLPFSSVGSTANTSRIAGSASSNALNITTALYSGWLDNFGIYNWALSPAEINAAASGSNISTEVFATTPGAPAGANIVPVYISFNNGTIKAAQPWNNTNKNPVQNDIFGPFLNENGVATTISIEIITPWQNLGGSGVNNGGVNTGNNSGIYPDAVIRSNYFANATKQTMRIFGLNPATRYNFTMMGSRVNPINQAVAAYTMAGQTLTLNTNNNSQSTVSFSNIQPQPDGSLTLDVKGNTTQDLGYIAALVITGTMDAVAPPAKPHNLAAILLNGKVNLNWVDSADNESGYEVYRATIRNGAYTLLNPGSNMPNLTQYIDSAFTPGPVYYYAVRAVNAGGGAYSDTVSIITDNAAPVISNPGAVRLRANEVMDVPITATDAPGDVITLSITGLPSFASFVDNGNGTGTLHVEPGSTTGIFNGITITAADNKSAVSTLPLSLNVKAYHSIYVNFNPSPDFASPAPWNNTSRAPSAPFTLASLQDEFTNSTNVNISLADAWTGFNTNGVVTGNNSGVYPDNVIRSFYYQSSPTARTIRVSGLSSAYKYSLAFFASRANYSDPLITSYTAGGQTVQLNATNNSSNLAVINNLVPDAGGQIEISVAAANGSPFAYLGAVEIRSYAIATLPDAPANLTATGIAKDKIRLNWTGTPSNNGYQVWRSTSPNGTYSLLANVAANTNTYTNTGLTANSTFYYKVRAIISGGFSEYSNIAEGSTIAFMVNINLNDGSVNGPAQSGGWNNTNALVDETFVLENLINDQNENTGTNFEMVRNFSGFNVFGTTTGNNSGIVPDNVLKSFFYTNYGDTAQFRITGLSPAYLYNFMLLGSRVNPAVGVVTAYKIGNQVITLNAANNTSNVAQFNDIAADENGSVLITMYNINAGGFGYLNSLQFQGRLMPDTGQGAARKINTTNRPKNKQAVTAKTANTQPADAGNAKATATAFPNPFTDDVLLKLNLQQPVEKLDVNVFDATGRIIYQRSFGNLPKGLWQQKLGLSGRPVKQGLYFIKVLGLPGQPAVIKLIKR
ncbi:fibronectin type III domain-containing protein [Foetidibacter luteolus]|uniref:fibronectin type III domain-containing protein n=1 Tax=Foetidibacter luteolus TaxID=2608880 RepID=UPI00129BED8E|nr:fibronectin type III domain-containing protein [Foetidibacter luteolus]